MPFLNRNSILLWHLPDLSRALYFNNVCKTGHQRSKYAFPMLTSQKTKGIITPLLPGHVLQQYSWHHQETGLAKSHSEFIAKVSKWISAPPFPKVNISYEPIWLITLTSCVTHSDLSMTTNSFLFSLSNLPNMYLPDFPQANRIYRSGNQLQLRCLLLPKACLGYTGICHKVYTHTNVAQTPWHTPTSPSTQQPCRLSESLQSTTF